jgi:molybdopterin-guanine dinucleotide biosynthesis protein A
MAHETNKLEYLDINLHGPISGVILAGGQGQRMGGVDKGLMQLEQRPLVSWICQKLTNWVDKIYISCNRNMHTYEAYGECFSDEIDDFQGPLSGLYSAANQVRAERFLVLPCDGPLVSDACISRLIDAAKTYPFVIAYDGDRLQPLYGVYPVGIASSIKSALDLGNRGVQRWLKSQKYHQVDLSDLAEDLLNINQPDDLLQAIEKVTNNGRVNTPQ